MLPLEKIMKQVKTAAEELIEASAPKPGQVFARLQYEEVLGTKIGTAGLLEAAQAIFDALREVTSAHVVYISQYNAANILTARW